MIAQLSGKLIEKNPDYAIIDVNGVGYQVTITLFTYYQLPEPENPIKLFVYTYVREDILSLFGFLNKSEKEIFLLLMSVTKVGAKMARNILSGVQPGELCRAVREDDLNILTKIPGVGKKVGQHLILELKDKINKLTFYDDKSILTSLPAKDSLKTGLFADIYSALENFGYSNQKINMTLQKMKSSGHLENTSLEDAIKIAFKILSN